MKTNFTPDEEDDRLKDEFADSTDHELELRLRALTHLDLDETFGLDDLDEDERWAKLRRLGKVRNELWGRIWNEQLRRRYGHSGIPRAEDVVGDMDA
jgi:hypothetical protein